MKQNSQKQVVKCSVVGLDDTITHGTCILTCKQVKILWYQGYSGIRQCTVGLNTASQIVVFEKEINTAETIFSPKCLNDIAR